MQISKKGTDLVKYLITKGADVNGGNDFGITPLQECARLGKSLNELNAKSLGFKWNDFRIDLFAAGNEEVAKALIENNANVSAKAEDRTEALHEAALKGERLN